MPELPLVGEDFAGYRLTAVLGRGGMSAVFRAESPRLGNVIALKVIDPALAGDDLFRARFLEESRIAASMNHPNVIPIHDTGASDGLLFIAMRCVAGTDLQKMIKKRGRLQPDTAVFLLEQAARALDAAHRRGLVHRDVKPGNLLIERGNDGDDPDHLYLTDFGITKHQGDRTGLTSTGQFLGTIDYVAPEQIRGTSVLGFADQYSLGCVLYECLTGRVPFEKDFDPAIMFAHVEETPAPMSDLRPDLPPALDEVFTRVLAKRPGDRYANCKDFMAAAREALGYLAEPTGSFGTLQPAEPYEIHDDVFGHRAPEPEPAPAEPVYAEPVHAGWTSVDYYPAPEPLAEVAHEKADAGYAQTSNWPRLQSATPPPPGDPRLPLGPPPGNGPEPGQESRRRPGFGLLAGIVALIVVAGTAAAVTLVTRGNNSAAGTAAAPIVAGAPTSVGMSMPPPLTTTPTTSASALPPASAMTAAARTAYCAPTGSVAETAMNDPGASGPTTLFGVLQQANLCSTPEGELPVSSCAQSSSTVVTCASPVKGIATVKFETFATLTALYSVYEKEIGALNGSYSANTKNSHCGPTDTAYAESGWNHLEDHPTQYTVAQMESPGFNQVDAMGRQACFVAGGTAYVIWTTDYGKMLAVAQGKTMNAVYNWWAEIHHVIIFPGTEMCGQTMGRMGSVPQGNLISLPTCPSGVTPAPAMSGM